MNSIDFNKNQLSQLARLHNVRLVYVFGSRARGDARENSDFDIAYQSTKSLSPRQHNELLMALREIFANNQCPIDLVDLATASPLLQYQVAREGKLAYGSMLLDALFYCHAVERYVDAAPLFELSKQYVKTSLAV